MTRCTTVDKHGLSVVVNPNQQVPHASNMCQWCDGSIRRPQLRLLSSKRHSVTIGEPVLLPTGLGTAHQPLQTSLSLELQLAEPELECHNVHMMPELVH